MFGICPGNKYNFLQSSNKRGRDVAQAMRSRSFKTLIILSRKEEERGF